MLGPYIPVVLWTLFILGLSIMPGVNLPETWSDLIALDKLAHFFVYGVLTYLGLRAIKMTGKYTAMGIAIVILLSALYGISLEWVQYSFFPGRYFETLDIIANIIGSLIGAGLFYFLQLRKPEAR